MSHKEDGSVISFYPAKPDTRNPCGAGRSLGDFKETASYASGLTVCKSALAYWSCILIYILTPVWN
jgi:hypothetical protein